MTEHHVRRPGPRICRPGLPDSRTPGLPGLNEAGPAVSTTQSQLQPAAMPLVTLCKLWLPASNPQWERVILTLDAGASVTVPPLGIARNVPLLHSNGVGIEYAVGNDKVVINFGKEKAEMKLKEDDVSSMLMSFQVVEAHKPLLAVSRLVEAGHHVRLNKADPDILLLTAAKIPMKNNMGTYESEVWILIPGFTGPK